MGLCGRKKGRMYIWPKLWAPKGTVHVPVQTVLLETGSQVCRVRA